MLFDLLVIFEKSWGEIITCHVFIIPPAKPVSLLFTTVPSNPFSCLKTGLSHYATTPISLWQLGLQSLCTAWEIHPLKVWAVKPARRSFSFFLLFVTADCFIFTHKCLQDCWQQSSEHKSLSGQKPLRFQTITGYHCCSYRFYLPSDVAIKDYSP